MVKGGVWVAALAPVALVAKKVVFMDEELRFTFREVNKVFQDSAVPVLNDLVQQNAVMPLLLLYYGLLVELRNSGGVDLHSLARRLEDCATRAPEDGAVQGLCESVAAYARSITGEESPEEIVQTSRRTALYLAFDADKPRKPPE